jgi:membrane fusion protein, multidrug efflux system
MKKTACLVLLVSILSGCSSKQTEEKLQAEKSTVVTVAKVKSEHVTVNFRYSGTVEPSQTIPLNFQSTGTVEKVQVDVGDAVQKGQLLATLDNKDMQNFYEITKSKYLQAKDGYDRLKTVHDQGSLTEIKWVEMETNMEQAKSSLELSKNNLEKCSLRAPVDGIIGRRNIEPGMSSLGITAPLELVQIATVFVKISVPENEVARIVKGMKASCSVSALDEKEYIGKVTNISPVADRISRTYEAKILVLNPGLILKPGMVCDVKMETAKEKEVILVPSQSVSKDNENRAYVFVVDLTEKRVRKQIIKTGQYRDSGLEVVSGLQAGQMIVNEGKEKLSDNSLISF